MDPGTQVYIIRTIIYNIQTKIKFTKKLVKSDIQHKTEREQVQDEGKSVG
jgi:hypothetical protein